MEENLQNEEHQETLGADKDLCGGKPKPPEVSGYDWICDGGVWTKVQIP